MIGSRGGSFRKLIEMTAQGASALKKKESGKSSLRDIVTKGKSSSGKRPSQVAIQTKLNFEGTTPLRKVEEKVKKKTTTNDIKIDKSSSKKKKSKSNKTNTSGPGDANL